MHRFLYTATIFSLKIPLLEIFLGLVSLGILFVAFMVLSAALVKVDIRDIYPTNKNRKDTKEIKIGFFSDSHGIGCLRSPKWIARHFIEKHCDVVLFGGDCVHHRNVHSSDTRLLTEISALLSEKNIDLIAVHGNHDWQLEKADYEKMGVLLLDDAWKELSGSAKIAVCGIADSERGNRPWGKIPSDFSDFDFGRPSAVCVNGLLQAVGHHQLAVDFKYFCQCISVHNRLSNSVVFLFCLYFSTAFFACSLAMSCMPLSSFHTALAMLTIASYRQSAQYG